MLSNAYFLVEFGFDKAENEPAKNLQNSNFAKIANFANQRRIRGLGRSTGPREAIEAGGPACARSAFSLPLSVAVTHARSACAQASRSADAAARPTQRPAAPAARRRRRRKATAAFQAPNAFWVANKDLLEVEV